jgi:hypothetical protein
VAKNNIGAAHLIIPVPDPEKDAVAVVVAIALETARVLELTILEGFGLKTGNIEALYQDLIPTIKPVTLPPHSWPNDD